MANPHLLRVLLSGSCCLALGLSWPAHAQSTGDFFDNQGLHRAKSGSNALPDEIMLAQRLTSKQEQRDSTRKEKRKERREKKKINLQERINKREVSIYGKEFSAEQQEFTFTVNGLENNQLIPPRFSYCTTRTQRRRKKLWQGKNISPGIRWVAEPEGTKSLVLLMTDKDAPVNGDMTNKPGRMIEQNAERQEFYHWVIVDIPASINGIREGADSNGIVIGGQPVGRRPYGVVGQNDFVGQGNGPHGGYEGPCPPWNDKRLHHYHFTLYALDIPSLKLPQPITPGQVKAAMRGHILASDEVIGTFTTYRPLLLRKLREYKMNKNRADRTKTHRNRRIDGRR